MTLQITNTMRVATYQRGYTIEVLKTVEEFNGKKTANFGETYWDNEDRNYYGVRIKDVLNAVLEELLYRDEQTYQVSELIAKIASLQAYFEGLEMEFKHE